MRKRAAPPRRVLDHRGARCSRSRAFPVLPHELKLQHQPESAFRVSRGRPASRLSQASAQRGEEECRCPNLTPVPGLSWWLPSVRRGVRGPVIAITVGARWNRGHRLQLAVRLPAVRLPAVRLLAVRLLAVRLLAVRLAAMRLRAERLPAVRLSAVRLARVLSARRRPGDPLYIIVIASALRPR